MIGKGRGKGIGGSSSGRGVDLGGAADWKEEAGGGWGLWSSREAYLRRP
jgi:hypothetical protein